MPAVAANSAIPPLTFAAGSCNSLGGQCVINPANPSVYIQAAPPAGDSFYIVPVLSYSTTNQAITNELGTRWVHTFKRQVQASGTVLTVVTGSGQSYSYSASHIGGGFASPTSNAVNSLQSSVGFTNFTETQPDGTVYQYGAPVSGTAPLLYIQNPAGARWTVTYDGSSRVSFITDPLLRRTTLAYDATSAKITSIQDPFGRLTSLTVNSSGDLVQIMSPELCIYSMVYSGGHLLSAWINPLGDRTTYTYPLNGLVVRSPLGAVTTLATNGLGGGSFRPRSPGGPNVIATNALGQVYSLT